MTSFRAALLALSLAIFAPNSLVEGLFCRVQSQPCKFPFLHAGNFYSQCVALEGFGRLVCPVNEGAAGVLKRSWGVCGDGCLNADGTPIPYGGGEGEAGEDMGAIFCKTTASRCVFPFGYDGANHTECAQSKDDPEVRWCATRVDESGVMVEGFWAECDMESCTEDDPEPLVASASVTSADGSVSGDLRFEQAFEDSELRVTGTIRGLEPDSRHGMHVHEVRFSQGEIDEGPLNCDAAGPIFNPMGSRHGSASSEVRHVGDLGNVEADGDGVAAVDITVPGDRMDTPALATEGNNAILGMTVVLHENEDDLGLAGTEDSREVGSSGARIACAAVVAGDGGSEYDLTLIYIIILVVVIVLLLLLILCLVCYCCCCRKRKRGAGGKDDPDLAHLANGANGRNGKVPLYDELSIPFIDASPAPTPKTGRSTERLSFFHRSSSIGRSRGSLSSGETKS